MQFHVTANQKEIDVRVVHEFLSQKSNWARGISLPLVRRAIKNSLCFAGFLEGKQIAFARVVSDYATFANLVDVFVLPPYRGYGYSKAILKSVLENPELQGLRRFTLATSDAHALYAKFGFAAPLRPQSFMEIYSPGVYEGSLSNQAAEDIDSYIAPGPFREIYQVD
jgi:GNAT superfamily N-acetyltransferase